MYKLNEFATHYIESKESLGFEPSDYSKFKFGLSSVGYKYGLDLWKGFHARFSDRLREYETIRVFGSPYQYLPTAAHTISNSFIAELSRTLPKTTVVEGKLNRATTYTVDYGSLTAAERMNLISSDTFNLDEEFDNSDLLIFIDDIKITGTHEKVVKKVLNSKSIQNDAIFLYHAVLVDQTVHPSFENELNYHHVKGIDELIALVNQESFAINTRFVKFTLGCDSPDFKMICNSIPYSLLQEIRQGANMNGYDKLDAFRENLEELSKLLDNELVDSYHYSKQKRQF